MFLIEHDYYIIAEPTLAIVQKQLSHNQELLMRRLDSIDIEIKGIKRALKRDRGTVRFGRTYNVFPIPDMAALEDVISKIESNQDFKDFVVIFIDLFYDNITFIRMISLQKRTIQRVQDGNYAEVLKKLITDDLGGHFNTTGSYGKIKAATNKFFIYIFGKKL